MDYARIVKNFLLKNSDVKIIYLYGSVITPHFRQESDIDVAAVFGKKLADTDLFNLQLDLGVAVDRDVDLVQFDHASSVLQMEILKNNRVIYCEDEQLRIELEARAMTDYGFYRQEVDFLVKERYGSHLF